jgi:cystathionine gamma-synthase
MTVTVVSKSPAGGRCTLYARYAEALAGHYGLSVDLHCPGETAGEGPPPPALVIRGLLVVPSDGVIVAPEDIVATLASAGLVERLDACRAELEIGRAHV